ncbi:MAG: hypothetical protein Q9227_002909 [Pyrenula ochraceoflavens]
MASSTASSTASNAWSRTKSISTTAYSKALKPGFDKAWHAMDKLGAPVNRLSNRVGAEAFWPTTMDKESDKAARILRAFCKDGFYADVDGKQAEEEEKKGEKVEGPKGKQRVLKKIPEKVIRECRGLAIFTTMRTGLWVSGAGGSGVLVAKDPETGEWSPPSGILLHTAGLGFLVGVDIYDCVVVINTEKALESFMKIRCTLGGEVSAVAGPVGIGGILESEIHKRQAPVWTYLKSRGFYAGVQVDGTVIIERTDENERFYGERIGVRDIMAGKAKTPPKEQLRLLMNTIKAAQGDQVDEDALPDAPAPSDMEIEQEGSSFGIPSVEDPDPYGVKALSDQGIEIHEAGKHPSTRPSQEAFEFKPATTSPIYATFKRQSLDSPTNHNGARSWRGSMQSVVSVSKDMGTQTDEESSPERKDTRNSLESHGRAGTLEKITQHVESSDEADADDNSPKELQIASPIQMRENDDNQNNGELTSPEPEPEPEPAKPQEAAVISKARIVTIPKRVPPSLPPRNPGRLSSPLAEETNGEAMESLSKIETAQQISPIDKENNEVNGIEKLQDGEKSEPGSASEYIKLVSDEAEKAAEKERKSFEEERKSKEEERSKDDDERETMEEVEKEKEKEGADEFHSIPVTPVDGQEKGMPGAF